MITTKLYIQKDQYKIPTVQYIPNTPESEGYKYPLVIFLHGNGEIGDGSDKGLDKLLNSKNHANLLTAADENGAIVLAPQFVQRYNDWRPEWAGGKYVDAVIEWALVNLPIDSNRIYLTGLSGGGGGCWDYISLEEKYCNKIAAVVPICGTEQSGLRDWSLVAKTNLPVWAFHALDDGVINVGATIRQINMIDSYDPDPEPIKTIYAEGGHGIWGRVYSDPMLYKWLFTKSRSSNPVEWIPNKRIHYQDGTYVDVFEEDI